MTTYNLYNLESRFSVTLFKSVFKDKKKSQTKGLINFMNYEETQNNTIKIVKQPCF
jgi:hypothetical protein